MTRETLLTNSQEELILQEYFSNQGEDMKELGNHLDIEPYSSFSSIELGPQNSFIHQYNEEQEPSLTSDDKMSLHDQISLVEHSPQQFIQQHQQYVAQPSVTLPTPIQCKEEFAGDYNFQLIHNNHSDNKHWVFSQKLKKIFIHMEQVLPLQFSWTPPQDGLWVRATMVYKLDHHRSQPVIRCHNHMAPDNNSNRNINPLQVKHVIRCTHNASTYEEAQNGHLSVLTPLGTPEAGVTTVPMDFMFYCKNSCTSGMNRRPTELIFTLETQQNQILGRRKVEIRVCSCPKRDKAKEEGETEKIDASIPAGPGSKKRKLVNALPAVTPPPSKKLMVDTKVYNMNLNVVGRDNFNAILKFAHDCMAGSAYRTNNYDLFKPYMDEISKKYSN